MWFEVYCEPRTVEECIDDLARHAPDAEVLAGGTDLIPRFKARTKTTKALINLMSVDGLASKKKEADGSVVIGAMTTLRSLMAWDGLDGPLRAVDQGIHSVSSLQVRNVATLGGNTCNASPAADTVPSLIASGAEVSIAGPSGTRRMLLEDFLLGPGRTALETGELLTGFHVPAQPSVTGSSYQKHAVRGSSDVAMVGVAARLSIDANDVVTDARVVLGAVAPTAIRSPGAEAALVGRVADAAVIDEAAAMSAEDSRPIDDVRASARYRREMVRVFARRAIHEAASRAADAKMGQPT